MWLSSPCSTIQLLHNSCRLSITISNPSPLCGTSVLRTRSDLPAIQGDSLTPLPVIHTATAFLQATIFCVSLPAPLTLRTISYKSHLPQRLLQPQRSSLSLAAIQARSALLALLRRPSLLVTFALLEAHTLSAKNILSALLATVAVPTIRLLAVVHSHALTPALALHVLASICT